jgi:hypothetical protein
MIDVFFRRAAFFKERPVFYELLVASRVERGVYFAFEMIIDRGVYGDMGDVVEAVGFNPFRIYVVYLDILERILLLEQAHHSELGVEPLVYAVGYEAPDRSNVLRFPGFLDVNKGLANILFECEFIEFGIILFELI